MFYKLSYEKKSYRIIIYKLNVILISFKNKSKIAQITIKTSSFNPTSYYSKVISKSANYLNSQKKGKNSLCSKTNVNVACYCIANNFTNSKSYNNSSSYLNCNSCIECTPTNSAKFNSTYTITIDSSQTY